MYRNRLNVIMLYVFCVLLPALFKGKLLEGSMHHNLQQVNESRFEENPSSSIQDDNGVQQQRRQYDKVDNEEQFQLSSRQPSDTQFIPMKNPSHAQPGQQTLQGQEYTQQDSQRDKEELIKKLRAAVDSSKDSAVTSSQNNSGIDDDGLNTWSIGETISAESAAATRTNGAHVQSAQLTAANKSVHAQSEEEVLQAEYIRLQFKLYGGPHQAFPMKANAELVEIMKAALESQERTRSAPNTQANVSTSGMWGRSIGTTSNSGHLPGQTFSQTSTPRSPHYHRPGMPTPPRAEHRNGAQQIETLKQRLPHSTNSVSHYVPVVMQPHKLPNGTQNCFMNASLQCCLAMLELNKLLTDSFLHTHATNDGTVHFYRDLCEGFTTKAHTSFTNHAWQWFKNRRQQDVDEFTGELFDAFKQHMQNVDSNTTDLGRNYFENRLISVLCVKESVTRNILEQNSQKLYSSGECHEEPA